ncbi:hypothetical protein BaRGS_00037825 [Batillaria attramentaria]|uniref:Uncharacterized protein n=1 Tax=Batillaria attramentaria TaxID=370345 RepID=A0ABD0J8E0_9CAEN
MTLITKNVNAKETNICPHKKQGIQETRTTADNQAKKKVRKGGEKVQSFLTGTARTVVDIKTLVTTAHFSTTTICFADALGVIRTLGGVRAVATCIDFYKEKTKIGYSYLDRFNSHSKTRKMFR